MAKLNNIKIKYFISAGERIPDKLYKEWKNTIQSPLLNCYGTTETLAIVIATRPGFSKIGSTGKPIPNVKTRNWQNLSRLYRAEPELLSKT